jgi:hypothetical protein
MDNWLYGLIAIIIAVAVVVVVGQVLAVPLTSNLAQVEQARAAVAQANADREQAQQEGHTERLQTFALALTGLVVIAKSPDTALFLLALLPWGAIGVVLVYVWHNRARG